MKIIEDHEFNELMIEVHIEQLKRNFPIPEFLNACRLAIALKKNWVNHWIIKKLMVTLYLKALRILEAVVESLKIVL